MVMAAPSAVSYSMTGHRDPQAVGTRWSRRSQRQTLIHSTEPSSDHTGHALGSTDGSHLSHDELVEQFVRNRSDEFAKLVNGLVSTAGSDGGHEPSQSAVEAAELAGNGIDESEIRARSARGPENRGDITGLAGRDRGSLRPRRQLASCLGASLFEAFDSLSLCAGGQEDKPCGRPELAEDHVQRPHVVVAAARADQPCMDRLNSFACRHNDPITRTEILHSAMIVTGGGDDQHGGGTAVLVDTPPCMAIREFDRYAAACASTRGLPHGRRLVRGRMVECAGSEI